MTAVAQPPTTTLDVAGVPADETMPTVRPTRTWPWAAATAVLAMVAVIVPLFFNHRFYFYDDTQIGWGLWYELGESLRDGRWPMLDPSRWMSGNVLVEGQWGVWNPVILVIGLLASTASNALVFSTVVKVAYLVFAALGVYWLARDHRTPAPLAMVAGLAAPLGGFTVYIDSPSWAAGLMTWAVTPWAWVTLRRLVRGEGGVLLPFVFSYLVVTVGYVHGALMLAVVYIAVLISGAINRVPRRGLLAVFGCGVLTALVTMTVFLPGALSSDVTWRTQRGIVNGDFLSPDLTGIVSGVNSQGLAVLAGWWPEGYSPAPIVFVAWFLPLLAFVDWRAAARRIGTLVDLLVVLGFSLAFVLGPSDIGPLRFPVRLMPYVVVSAVVLVAVLLGRFLARPVTRTRLLVALGWVVVASYLGWAGRPPTWKNLGLGAVITAIGIVATYRLLSRGRDSVDWRKVAFVIVGFTLVLGVLQRHTYRVSPLPDFGLTPEVAVYREAGQPSTGDVIVVGSASAHGSDLQLWREALLGNTWYVPDATVQNVYTAVGHARYGEVTCMNWRGETCPDLINRLFTVQPTTGLLLADQLSISTVLMFTDEVGDISGNPPFGWSVASVDTYTTTWTRDVPLESAGGVVWQTAGLALTELERTDTDVTLRVDGVPAGGGQAVLSRLDWPGYTASGATIAPPTDGYLLTVDVPADSAGQTVTITFRPPAWRVELVMFGLAIVGLLAWVIGGRDPSPVVFNARVAATRRQRP